MCLLTFFPLRRGFLRVFDISTFRFLLILCRGLGHHFGSCLASPAPLWSLSRSSRPLLLSLMGARVPQERLKTDSFLVWRTLAKHAQACTDRTSPSQTAQNQGRHREISKKHEKSTESAPGERQGTPQRASGAPQGTQEEASRAQKTPQKEYSGALAVPN